MKKMLTCAALFMLRDTRTPSRLMDLLRTMKDASEMTISSVLLRNLKLIVASCVTRVLLRVAALRYAAAFTFR